MAKLYCDINNIDIKQRNYNRIEIPAHQPPIWGGIIPPASIVSAASIRKANTYSGGLEDTYIKEMHDATYYEDKSLTMKYGDKKTIVVTNSYPITFDIETNPDGTSWCQQVTINDTSILLHTWEDTMKVFDYISAEMDKITANNPGVIAVATCLIANLGFEFQYLRKRLDFSDVFATGTRRPLTAMTHNIIFKDPLRVSNSSLAKLSDLYNLPTKKAFEIINGKKVMDLDYSKPRTSKWVLTDKEKDYCYNDVEILADFYIWCLENYVYQGMPIPQTATGMCRDTIKKLAKEELDQVVEMLDKNGCPITTKKGKVKTTHRLTKFAKTLPKMFPETLAEYDDLMTMTFVGGYTKSNFLYTGIELHNVNGGDFTSSYPASMIFGKYPMTPFRKIDPTGITIKDILKQSDDMAIISKIRFKKLRAKTTHSIQSISKTYEYKECNARTSDTIKKYHMVLDNGRVYYADQMTVSITELDLEIFNKYYTWEDYEILSLQTSHKDYLPDYVRYAVLKFYQIKARLKNAGLDGTTEYKIAKAMVNSFYGMMCEKIHIFLDTVDCKGGKDCWYKTYSNVDQEHVYKCQIYGLAGDPEDCDTYIKQVDQINKIESGKMLTRRYLSPYWAVYTTSISRYNLLLNVQKVNEDVLYCDTDSMYFMDNVTGRTVINNWNEMIHLRNRCVVEDWNNTHDEKIDIELVLDLGEFDLLNKHGNYTRFKTLGCKRYLKTGPEKNKKTKKIETVTISTIAGLPKTALTEYAEKIGKDPYELFVDGMCIPDCKKAHTYIDEPFDTVVTDEQGNTEIMHEESAIVISNIDFSMSLSDLYRDLLSLVGPDMRFNNSELLDTIHKITECAKELIN